MAGSKTAPTPLETVLRDLTREADPALVAPLEEKDWLQCFACGHRCKIGPGRSGVCRVRFNEAGSLRVPFGYVGALQVDPIEKKPFFHVLPGSRALSFGMLGCDFHCAYCFLPGTRVLTERGHLKIERIYAESGGDPEAEEEIVPCRTGLRVFTHSGKAAKVAKVFRHQFRGKLVQLRPASLPWVETTPDHPFLAVRRAGRKEAFFAPEFVPANRLTREHLLAIPKDFEFSEDVVLDAGEILAPMGRGYRIRHRIGLKSLERILRLSRSGWSSRQIGAELDLDPSHVRHLRSKVGRGIWRLDRLGERTGGILREGERVRFTKEHSPGIRAFIPLDPKAARLLGLFCAEGSVQRSRGRRNAANSIFSFGPHERNLAEQTRSSLERCLGLPARIVVRPTTLNVEIAKASAALLFEALCGTGSRKKRVPEFLFRCHRPVVKAFLDGYAAGDGYRSPNGSVTISTVSESLAGGVAGLLIKLGIVPQWYSYSQPVSRRIQGRRVRQSPRVFVVRWHPVKRKTSQIREIPGFFLLPIREIRTRPYRGPVYNLEVEGENSYLANGVAVHNCQNWITSQAIRDPNALADAQVVRAEDLVDLAFRHCCPVVTSTYNEPLITSEWAAEVFRVAKRRGLLTSYVSNGNATEEVLRFIRPHVDLYKVDLKSFRDSEYRKLGGKLETVTWTIRRLVEMGFWTEIVTLIVPGLNDSPEELRETARFLASVSPDIPWHVTAFHPDYKMTDRDGTPARKLLEAYEIGREEGLRYVYAGNLPGRVGKTESTFCPGCGSCLVERVGYRILAMRVREGACPDCGRRIPGLWEKGGTLVPVERK